VANCNCCRATASLTSGVVAVAATGPSCPHPCFLSDYYVFSTASSSITVKQFPTLLAFKVEIKHSILWIDQKILSVATSVDCVVHEAADLHTAASGFIFEYIKFRLFSLNDVSTIRSLFFMF
jgi:hypothetical protein